MPVLDPAIDGGDSRRWDVVVTSYFLDTQRDPAAAVRRIARLLAPGGRW